jgi:hypothetical protein
VNGNESKNGVDAASCQVSRRNPDTSVMYRSKESC